MAASIAEALMEDSGPDLDSLIDRMLTLTPSSPTPTEVLKELDRLDRENEKRNMQEDAGAGAGTLNSRDVPPELPPKQRPGGVHPNGDLFPHMGENGAVASAPEEEVPPPRVPPRRRLNKDKESDNVGVFSSWCLTDNMRIAWPNHNFWISCSVGWYTDLGVSDKCSPYDNDEGMI